MPILHLGYGNKGGVGKSTFIKVLIEYYGYKQWVQRLYDLDAGNHDVGIVYAPDVYDANQVNTDNNKGKDKGHNETVTSANGELFLQFTDNKSNRDRVDTLFESAMMTDTIVNLPSNVKHMLNPWIENNGLIKLAADHGVRFVQWFICSGEKTSIKEFYATLDKFKNCSSFTHVFVKNYGLLEDWDRLLSKNTKLKETLEADSITTLDLPELSTIRYDKILDNNLTFSTAKSSEHLNVIDKQAVKQFLDKNFNNLDSVFNELGISGQVLAEAN